MFNGDEYVTAKGVILSRKDRGENLFGSVLFHSEMLSKCY